MPTIARRAILLGGVSGDRSVSMRRFAREMLLAMAGRDPTWQVELMQPAQTAWLSRLWTNGQATRVENALARYLVYPIAVARKRGDLFHVLDHAYGHLVKALDASRTVVTCHDLIPLRCADNLLPMRVPPLVVRTVRLRLRAMVGASRILTDSEATRTDVLHYTSAPASKITVIRPGVSPIFHPAAPDTIARLRGELGVPDGVSVILQVATTGRYKNTPVLLKALAHLRRRLGGTVMLVRIGAPFHEDEGALAQRLGVAGGIRHLGAVDDPTLARWYRAAAALAFPSLWEGFGWPPLEAMASGTPVVASRIAAVEEVVQDAAALIDPRDDVDLATALARVITEPAYAAQLRRCGLQRAGELTWSESARRTLAVYEEVSAS